MIPRAMSGSTACHSMLKSRVLYLSISQISVQQIKRETTSAWHCMIHGDLFELAEADWAAENDPQVGSSSAQGENGGMAAEALVDEKEAEKPAYLPPAPKGLVYRQVNEPHSEVMCDIFGKSPSSAAMSHGPRLIDRSPGQILRDEYTLHSIDCTLPSLLRAGKLRPRRFPPTRWRKAPKTRRRGWRR